MALAKHAPPSCLGDGQMFWGNSKTMAPFAQGVTINVGSLGELMLVAGEPSRLSPALAIPDDRTQDTKRDSALGQAIVVVSQAFRMNGTTTGCDRIAKTRESGVRTPGSVRKNK